MQHTSRPSIRHAAFLSILTGLIFVTLPSDASKRAMVPPPMFDTDMDTDGIADPFDPIIMPPPAFMEVTTAETMPVSCTNMLDDDSDGTIDYMDMDGGSECDMVSTVTSCTNMLDDDSDGMIDLMDMDSGSDCDMVSSMTSCTNMSDDDADGMMDYMDIDSGTDCDQVTAASSFMAPLMPDGM